MANTNIVEAMCNYKGDAYGFSLVPELQGPVYVCTVPCDMRLRDGRTLVVLGKIAGEYPVNEVSMCGMPECRFAQIQG